MNNDRDLDAYILDLVAGHTERARLQRAFNLRLREANKATLTASCCGKVFNTQEQRVNHESESFLRGHKGQYLP